MGSTYNKTLLCFLEVVCLLVLGKNYLCSNYSLIHKLLHKPTNTRLQINSLEYQKQCKFHVIIILRLCFSETVCIQKSYLIENHAYQSLLLYRKYVRFS